MDIAELAQLAERHQSTHEAVLLTILDNLHDIDPEIVNHAINVLGKKSPCRCVAYKACPIHRRRLAA